MSCRKHIACPAASGFSCCSADLILPPLLHLRAAGAPDPPSYVVVADNATIASRSDHQPTVDRRLAGFNTNERRRNKSVQPPAVVSSSLASSSACPRRRRWRHTTIYKDSFGDLLHRLHNCQKRSERTYLDNSVCKYKKA